VPRTSFASARPFVGVLLSVVAVLGCRGVGPAAPTPAPAAIASTPASEPVPPHQTFTVDSRVLGETRRINLYTPPGYERSRDARYPVLYMPDGGMEEDFPHVANDVDVAIRAGEMRPVIVVGIENTERRRDMTGPTEVEEDRKIAPRVGGSAAFRAFIRDELMPEIGRRVRGNGQTAIVGESLAGLFVVETFLLEPALFDTYIALSPSLWWNAQALVLSMGGSYRRAVGTRTTTDGFRGAGYGRFERVRAGWQNFSFSTLSPAALPRAHPPLS